MSKVEENLGVHVAQFVGAVAPGQGLFFIDDVPGDNSAKDLSTLALIEVIEGEVSAKKIENEFKILAGEESTWRWYAKKVANIRFQMRFPTVKRLLQTSHFTDMRLRSVPSTVIVVKQWSVEICAKGKLEEAWFRVKGIPIEKRSIPNISKVGSLVGVTKQIDKR